MAIVNHRREATGRYAGRLRLLSLLIVALISLLLNLKSLREMHSPSDLSVEDDRTARFHSPSALSLKDDRTFEIRSQSALSSLKDDPFCNSIKGALAQGPTNRTMIHTFVSNSGHLPFLHNVLLSMIRNQIKWKPLVLAMGEGVCPMLANIIELRDQYLCVPYLDRHLEQLERDEPKSVTQILVEGNFKKPNNVSDTTTPGKDENATKFHMIDNRFYGWGSVEHKFLINVKLYALRDILTCGADAFISDTDIGFRKDPRPYFNIPGQRGDIIAQNDTTTQYVLSLNSGFMYWRNTPQNMKLIDDIINIPPFWHVDQARVNRMLYDQKSPHTLLDAFKFPNGAMLNRFFKDLDDIVVLHANWNSKRIEKEEMLQRAGLWFLNETNLS